jgi:hypothetical protein
MLRKWFYLIATEFVVLHMASTSQTSVEQTERVYTDISHSGSNVVLQLLLGHSSFQFGNTACIYLPCPEAPSTSSPLESLSVCYFNFHVPLPESARHCRAWRKCVGLLAGLIVQGSLCSTRLAE